MPELSADCLNAWVAYTHTLYVGLYLKTGYSLPGHRHHSGGSRGVAPEPVTGIQRALGEPTGSPWPPARPSGKQWRRQVRALEREQHPAQPNQLFHGKKYCAPAQPAQSPGSRRVRAHLTSCRGRLRSRPACMLLLWVVQMMFCSQRLLPASVLQLLSVAQPSSRSLTAIAAHPLCRAVSSLEGGRGRPPEQCREREEKGGGCAMLMNVNVATVLAPPKISKLPPRPRMSRRP